MYAHVGPVVASKVSTSKSLCLFTAVQTDCVMVTVSKGSTHTSSVVSMWEEGIRTKDYGKCMQGFIHHRVCW